jgi:hypothetical protein
MQEARGYIARMRDDSITGADMRKTLVATLALLACLTVPALAAENERADELTTGSLPVAEAARSMAGSAGEVRNSTPNIIDLFFSRKNPVAQVALAMNEACPSDVLGLARDVGELVGLVDAPTLQLPEGGTFADKMRALAEQRHVQKSLLERMLSRSCLYNRLFGDGTCGKD